MVLYGQNFAEPSRTHFALRKQLPFPPCGLLLVGRHVLQINLQVLVAECGLYKSAKKKKTMRYHVLKLDQLLRDKRCSITVVMGNNRSECTCPGTDMIHAAAKPSCSSMNFVTSRTCTLLFFSDLSGQQKLCASSSCYPTPKDMASNY